MKAVDTVSTGTAVMLSVSVKMGLSESDERVGLSVCGGVEGKKRKVGAKVWKT